MDRLHRSHAETRAETRAGFVGGATVEPLEARWLMSAEVRSIDGTGNNLANPDWGSVNVQLLRQAAAAYADGVSSPAGAGRPSARAISNAVSTALEGGLLNDRDLSAFVYVWGQFVDHDMDLTVTATSAEPFNVLVPTGDPQFDPPATGTQVIRLNRSAYDPVTGTSVDNPREQTNAITAWIDGSMIYGSDAARAAALRTFVGGQLNTGDDGLLPFNLNLLPNDNAAHLVPDDKLFLAGDARANENIELTALHTLFVREHNRIAAALASRYRRLNDEALYQQARQVVVGEIQAITYNEFLPALLGHGALDRYTGYDPTVNPGIANEFSTAAFRLGHSLLGDDVEFLDENGEEVRGELPLSGAFFNPAVVAETGLEPILKYLASDRAQELDIHIVDGVRNFLFGLPGAGGFDLATLNIQRGRDHGLADYNTTRVAYGLTPVDSFDDITSDPQLQVALADLYGSVDNIDLWVGGLAEDHVAGGSVGELFRTILVDQFERLRDGDRFWYQAQQLSCDRLSLERTSLADVIRRNTDLSNVQDNVFFFDVTIEGTVYQDANRNSLQDRRERGLAGWTVELLDADGNVVDSTVTSATGRYRFSTLDLGGYQVRVVAPSAWTHTGGESSVFTITRGTKLKGVNYGYAPPAATATA